MLDGVGTGRIELGRGGRGASAGNGRRIGHRGAVPPARDAATLGRRALEGLVRRCEPTTLAGLGGAGQVVADHLERAIEALTPAQRDIAARLFDHLVTPSGTKIAHEASDLAQFASASESDVRGVVRRPRRPSHPPHGRGRSLGDLPRRPRRRRARLEDALRGGARGRLAPATRHGDATDGSPSSRSVRSSLSRPPARSPSSRSPSAARRASRRASAQSGQLVASALSVLGQRPRARHRARARGGPDRADAARRGRPPRGARRVTRPRRHLDTGHPVVGMDVDPSGRRVLVVGDDRRRACLRARDRRAPLVASRGRGRRGVRSHGGRSVVVVVRARSWRRSTRRRGGSAGRPVAVALPGVVEELVPSPDGSVGDRRSSASRGRVRSTLASGARLGRVKHLRAVTDAAFAPGGRLVASSGRDRTGRIWDTRILARGSGASPAGTTARCSRSRSTGSAPGSRPASTDQTARVWWTRTGRLFTTLFGHTSYVSDVAFGPGSVLVTASADGTARTWRAEGVPAAELLGPPWSRFGKPSSPQPTAVVTGGVDGTIRIWDPARASCARAVARRSDRSSSSNGGGRRRLRDRATADGHVVRLRTVLGRRTRARGTQGRRQRGRVQPGRQPPRERRSRPRRDRVGRGDRYRGVPDRRGAVRLGQRCSVQSGRALARHRRPEVGPALDAPKASWVATSTARRIH